MTRIVVVEPNGAGGLIHYAYQMCTALAEAGAEVTLITAADYELGELPHNFRVEPMMKLWPTVESQVHNTRLGALVAKAGRKLRRVRRGFRYANQWRRVTRRVLEIQPDVAQFSVIRFPFLALFLRRVDRAGIALGQICHEFERREFGRIARWLNHRLSVGVYRYFDVIFLHARENADRFLASFPLDPEVVRIIPHGNESIFVELADAGGDMRSRYGIDEHVPVALFFGGIRPSKGVPDLITAFARVREEIEAHLVIAGPAGGVDVVSLRELVWRLHLEADVTIDPRYIPMAEIGALVRMASVVTLPYRSATASGVLQVAYAFGKPVVATEIGALTTDVRPGETGLLVPPDDPDALANALVKILSDPAEASRMGDRARDIALELYAWKPIAERVLKAYAEVDR